MLITHSGLLLAQGLPLVRLHFLTRAFPGPKEEHDLDQIIRIDQEDLRLDEPVSSARK